MYNYKYSYNGKLCLKRLVIFTGVVVTGFVYSLKWISKTKMAKKMAKKICPILFAFALVFFVFIRLQVLLSEWNAEGINDSRYSFLRD